MSRTDESVAGSSPPRGGFLRSLAMVGPGIVVTGSVIGSGELVNTPVQAAKFGFILLWAVVLACVIKYFLQVEIARHCMVHNRTTFQALRGCPGPRIRGASWIGIVYMLGYIITMLPVVGILGALGGLMHGLWPLAESEETSVHIWAAACTLLALGLLWRGIYNHLEKLVAVLVAGFSLSVAIGLLLIQGTDFRITGEEFFSGLTFSLGDDPAAAAFAVISLMGALGVAANELFMYPYWVLEKGYAEQLGAANDAGWVDRARQLINTIRLDAGLSTLLATVVTAAFFLLGCAVLFRQGIEPEGLKAVEQISSVYTATYGEWSRVVFMIGAFCTLFSTLVVYTAASGRMWTDLAVSLRFVDRDNPKSTLRCLQGSQLVWLAALFAGYYFMEKQPQKLIVLGHFVLGVFMTPLLMFAICWMAFHTDRRVRMSASWATALVASAGVIVACVLGWLYFTYAAQLLSAGD